MSSGEKKRILVVDDSAINLKLLKNLLAAQGWTVFEAQDGRTALEIIARETLDLGLLDIHLPDLSGLEICRHIKANPLTADLPVIFISAMDSVEDKVQGFEAGGADYVTKPFYKEEVLVRVKTQLTIRDLQLRLKQKINELEGLYQEVKELSLRDALTGLYNRRYLNEALSAQVSYSKRYKKPLSVIIGDIDHFKSVNDQYSHQVGDAVLQRVGSILQATVRDCDTAARYGGEEFFVFLPETPSERARMVAERIRAAVQAFPWSELNPRLSVTISLGLAFLESPEDFAHLDQKELLAQADARLYEAKRDGRNCVR